MTQALAGRASVGADQCPERSVAELDSHRLVGAWRKMPVQRRLKERQAALRKLAAPGKIKNWGALQLRRSPILNAGIVAFSSGRGFVRNARHNGGGGRSVGIDSAGGGGLV